MKMMFRVWWYEEMWYYPNKDIDMPWYVGMDGTVFDLELDYDEAWMEKFTDAIPMLATGLKDKNGKDIYEGDILKVTFLDGDEDGFTSINLVEWFQQLGKWQAKPVDRNSIAAGTDLWFNVSCDKAEVIGNKYENPELMEV